MEGEFNGRPEAQRCLGIAEKLLTARDLVGSKNFAARAQENDPFLDGVDQILAIVDVLLAAEKRINNHFDWYAILQLGSQSNDLELIKKKYKRLALLLHPDKNKSVFADNAFKFVVDAWAVLSNPSKKTLYDNELNLFSKLVSSQPLQQHQQPVKVNPRDKKRKASKEQNFNSGSSRIRSLMSTFWTTCPYCYNLYEYPRVYEECCLRCEKCKRAFHAVMVKSLPPSLPGKEEFYCCWSLFPLAFSVSNSGSGKPKFPGFPNWMSSSPMFPPPPSTDKNAEFPKWMPFSPMFPSQPQGEGNRSATAAAQVNLDNDGHDDYGIIEDGNLSTHVQKRALSNKKTEENAQGEAKKDDDVRTEALSVTIPKPQMRKKTVAKRTQKQKGRGPQGKKAESRAARESEKLDLNGEWGNEAKDSEPTTGEGTDAGSGDEDVASGSGFFEGLDEFLGNLPILNAVNDGEKVEGGSA
ncbi:uncharacterized protein LOC122660099 isoform X2 [Telopea speciosissima]|uniref:uncharacterized protein LOC122660099 isoform X2 n=1 Tax=Telopea speciosissima TaxID=54955 RepID=UPI001CC7A0C9|nr:uncharacterized protein LOC122660099 isoform X2 [Telopea speciosissima]